MADKHHTYSIRLDWTGNRGSGGTSAYRDYSRAHEITARGKTAIAGSSDPVFRGDEARWNPALFPVDAFSTFILMESERLVNASEHRSGLDEVKVFCSRLNSVTGDNASDLIRDVVPPE